MLLIRGLRCALGFNGFFLSNKCSTIRDLQRLKDADTGMPRICFAPEKTS